MTFEDTIDRASVTSEPKEPVRRAKPAFIPNTSLDTMMDFVDQGGLVADQLRGLTILFRGTFCEPDARNKLLSAADIIADCMDSMASRLDLIGEQARTTRDHLAARVAR